MARKTSSSLPVTATSSQVIGDIAEKLAVDPVAEEVSKFMTKAATEGLAVAVGGISAACVAPVLGYAAIFGGALWLGWRKERKNERELRELFGAVHDAIEVAQQDAARSRAMIEEIHGRKTFVQARIPGGDWAEHRRRTVEDIIRELDRRGIPSTEAVAKIDVMFAGFVRQADDHEQAESERHALVKHDLEQVIETKADKADLAPIATKDDLAAMEARMVERLRAARPAGAPADAGTEKDLVAAVERLARDAERGGVTAQRVLQSENPGDVADYLSARRSQLERGQQVLNQHIDEEKIKLDRELAAVAYTTGRIDEAEAALGRIIALTPTDRDAINRLGQIHILRGRLAEAETSFRYVLELSAHDELWQAAAHNHLGLILRRQGDLDRAEAMHRKAIAINEKLGRLDGLASAYGNLGLVMQTRGDLDGAEVMHRKAIAINEKLGRLEGMANQYGNLGILMGTCGDLDGAEAMFRKALAIEEKLGRLDGMASAYGNLGLIMQTRGDLDGAEAMHRQSLAIHEKLGNLQGMAIDYGNLGLVMQTRGDLDGAEAIHRKSLAIEEKLGRLEGMASDYSNLGVIMQARGDLDEARKSWITARDLFTQLGAKHMVEKIQGWIDELPAK